MRKFIALLVGAVLVLAGCAVPEEGAAGSPDGKSVKSEKKATRAGIGRPAKDGKFTFTVTKIRYARSVGDQYVGTKAQGRFALVHIKVANHGDEARTLDASSQKLLAAGKTYQADNEAAITMASKAFLEDINPGNSVSAVVPFDIPANVRPSVIELHDSPFSGGVKVSLR